MQHAISQPLWNHILHKIGDGGRDAPVRTEFLRGFDPFTDDDFDVAKGFLIGLAVRSASGQFGDLGNEGLVFLTPVDDDFVFSGHWFPPACMRV